MNYYEHHLGDYKRDAAHLTMLQEAAYRRLLDAYYARETPIPAGAGEFVYQLAGAHSKPEKASVNFVLEQFFKYDAEARVYRHKRCDQEIARFREKAAKAKASAQTRWSRTERSTERDANASNQHMRNGCETDANAMPTHCEGNALQSPVTSNQTPDTNHKSPEREQGSGRNGHTREGIVKRKASRRVPAEFEPDEQFALDELPDIDVQTEIAGFRDWEFKTPRSDWPACWRTWIRNAKASGKYARKPGSNATTTDEALEAWKALLAGKERDQRTQDALDAIGGWGRVLHRTGFEDAKVRSEFCNAWRTAA